MPWVAHWLLPIAVFWCVLFVQNKVQKNQKRKAGPEKSSNTGDLESIRVRSGVWEQRRQQSSGLIGEHSPGPISWQKAQRYSRKYPLSPLDIPLPKAAALTLWKILASIFKYWLHSWRWYPSWQVIKIQKEIQQEKNKVTPGNEKDKTENIRRQSQLFYGKKYLQSGAKAAAKKVGWISWGCALIPEPQHSPSGWAAAPGAPTHDFCAQSLQPHGQVLHQLPHPTPAMSLSEG